MRSQFLKQPGLNRVLHAVRRKSILHSRQQDFRTISITAPPVLRKAKEDGSGELQTHTTDLHMFAYLQQKQKFQKRNCISTLGTDGCTIAALRYDRHYLTCSRTDEPENIAIRYRRFNCDALMDVAVKAVGHGARSCKNRRFRLICEVERKLLRIIS